MPDLPADFFRQNEWANLALIDACRGLSDEQLDTSVEGVYGSIRATLQHIVSSETSYATRLGGDVPKLRWDDPWPGFDRLVELAKATGMAFVAASQDVTDEPIQLGSKETYDVEPVVILTQMFHHGTEHRSQVATILTSLGIDPPDLSGWEWGLKTDRMRRIQGNGTG
ncbi:MAG: DinB family protein [Acidimicrobiia bacterium]|nr:DinB family protein [Acidimicrobiia bacterium]